MIRSILALVVCFVVTGVGFAADKTSAAVKAKAKAKACAVLSLADLASDRSAKPDLSSRSTPAKTEAEIETPVKVVVPKVPRERFVIVSTEWCVPCQAMKAKELPALKKAYAVEEVDGDQVKSYGVSSYPTVIFERDGREVWRATGYTSAETLKALAREK